MEESFVRNRIKNILSATSYSVNKLAKGDGSYRAKLNKQINGETTISAETILLVLATFPDISAEWLLRGEGAMYKNGTTSAPSVTMDTMTGGQLQVGGSHNSMHTHADASAYADIIKMKDEQIADLKADKDNLMALLKAMSTK